MKSEDNLFSTSMGGYCLMPTKMSVECNSYKTQHKLVFFS